VLNRDGAWYRLRSTPSLDDLLQLPAADLRLMVDAEAVPATDLDGAELDAPIEGQEVWAAGVTYRRSLEARVDEAVSADPYDRVYTAERPELFFKASASRVRGPGQPVYIRADSTWDVPEPELAAVCNSRLEVIGYTIGNDVSSRSIEGENPLYLPQAKVYDGSCALGPWIVLAGDFNPERLTIELEIARGGSTAFAGRTSTSEMKRSIAELVAYLGRDQRFDVGCVLLTGTGIVPPREFTLADGDIVTIRIDAIGSLVNPVRRHPTA